MGIIIGQTLSPSLSFLGRCGKQKVIDCYTKLYRCVSAEGLGERRGHEDGTSSSGKRLGWVWRRLELKRKSERVDEI